MVAVMVTEPVAPVAPVPANELTDEQIAALAEKLVALLADLWRRKQPQPAAAPATRKDAAA
jgi:hypothetical protein